MLSHVCYPNTAVRHLYDSHHMLKCSISNLISYIRHILQLHESIPRCDSLSYLFRAVFTLVTSCDIFFVLSHAHSISKQTYCKR